MRKDCHKPTYRTWRSMKSRCNLPCVPSYKYYGKVGISYDPAWESFDNFLKDMGERPEGTSLDRIDNTKNYQKDNCRWSTHSEQMRNRKMCLQVTYNGITKTAAEWAKDMGLSKSAVWNRIKIYGWSVEKSLTTARGG